MPPNTLFSTPARLTAPAAVKLPRQILILVGLIYIFAGLFFRDPWKTDDVVGLATMITALESGTLKTWLLPQVGNLAYAEAGPFITWAGSISISVLAPALGLFTNELNATMIASRFPNLIWFALLCIGVWRAAYWLGRRPEAQPLALPFGGEPSVTDYGRMIADATLLLTLATVGIIWRMHETSEVPALIALQAVALYSLVRIFQRPGSGAVLLGITLGLSFLTRGLIGAVPILLASVAAFALVQPLQRHAKWLALSLALALAVFMAWWLPAKRLGPYWTEQWWLWNIQSIGWVGFSGLISSLRDLAWFLWPTWPLTLLALWHWRAWVKAPHLLLPLLFLISSFLSLFFLKQAFEPEYALLVLPCAMLGAFALPTLRRGIVNALDWFAIMCFSLTAATVWLGWIAQQSGWPSKIAHNIARQTQGYDSFISIPALFIAFLGTLSWLLLVRWRLRVRPAGLLRGSVLSAGGLITTWLLLVTLWMPSLDYVRSYRSVSAELAQALNTHQLAGECLRAESVGAGQRASFLVFERINLSFDQQCPLVLQQVSLRELQSQKVPSIAPDSQILWQGKRGADRHEAFLLLRVPKP